MLVSAIVGVVFLSGALPEPAFAARAQNDRPAISLCGFACDSGKAPVPNALVNIVHSGRILATVTTESDGWFAVPRLPRELAGSEVMVNIVATGYKTLPERVRLESPITVRSICKLERLPEGSEGERIPSAFSFLHFHVLDAFEGRPMQATVSVTFEHGDTLVGSAAENGFATIAYNKGQFDGQSARWVVSRGGYRDVSGELQIQDHLTVTRAELLPNATIVPLTELPSLLNRAEGGSAPPAYIVTDFNRGMRTVMARWKGGEQQGVVGERSWKVMLPASVLQEDKGLVFDSTAPLGMVGSSQQLEEKLIKAFQELANGFDETSSQEAVKQKLNQVVAQAADERLFTIPKLFADALREGRVGNVVRGEFLKREIDLLSDARLSQSDRKGEWLLLDSPEDRSKWSFRLVQGANGVDVFLVKKGVIVESEELADFLIQASSVLAAAHENPDDDSVLREFAASGSRLLVKVESGLKAQAEPGRPLFFGLATSAGRQWNDDYPEWGVFLAATLSYYPRGSRHRGVFAQVPRIDQRFRGGLGVVFGSGLFFAFADVEGRSSVSPGVSLGLVYHLLGWATLNANALVTLRSQDGRVSPALGATVGYGFDFF